MSEIKLGTFKKLFNVKKGGAEFFRLVVKISVAIFTLGAMFYGLMYIPNENFRLQSENFKIQKELLSIKSTELNIEIQRVDSQCKITAQNVVLAEVQKAKKAEKKIEQKDQNNIFVSTYTNCVNLQGMSFLAPQQKQVAKPAVKNNKK